MTHPEHTLDFQERGEELIFVLSRLDRICELLAIVKWLQQGLEAVVDDRHRGMLSVLSHA